MSREDESMQEGKEEREKTTVRMWKRFPSTGHTDVVFALLPKQETIFLLFYKCCGFSLICSLMNTFIYDFREQQHYLKYNLTSRCFSKPTIMCSPSWC